MKKLLFIIFALTIALGQDSFSQSLTKSGTAAAQFLKIPVGSRAIGMGGAFAATSNDISAIYWNPAGLATSNMSEASFNHVDWIADVSYQFAAFSTQIGGLGSIGAFVSVLTMDEMMVRTVDQPEGTGEFFNAGDLAIGLSYSRNLTDRFSIGFNVKYIRQYIWHSSATGIGADVGVLYRIPVLNELRLAGSIANFGTKMQMQGRDLLEIAEVGPGQSNLINTDVQTDQFDLPLIFRVGIASDIVKVGSSRLTTEINAVHPNDNTEYVNAGFEYGFQETFFVRGGYGNIFERDTEKGFTLGAGVNYQMGAILKLTFDYAFQQFGRLKEMHYFTLGVKF